MLESWVSFLNPTYYFYLWRVVFQRNGETNMERFLGRSLPSEKKKSYESDFFVDFIDDILYNVIGRVYEVGN